MTSSDANRREESTRNLNAALDRLIDDPDFTLYDDDVSAADSDSVFRSLPLTEKEGFEPSMETFIPITP